MAERCLQVFLCISDVLPQSRVEEFRERFARAAFVDGRRTAGIQAKVVKSNGQLDAGSPLYAEAASQICGALQACELFQAAALPRLLSPIIINRYAPGMSYGSHVDNALMGSPSFRADVSFTLFLSEPDGYSGGELVIEDTSGDTPIKLSSGSLVLYSSTYLHRVEEVREGIRYAAVGWVQSHVPLSEHRRLLFQLYQCRLAMSTDESNDCTNVARGLALIQSNLTRLWAVT